MNTTAIAAITFSLGAGVGYLVTAQLLDKKYADIAQEEIDSVKKMYRNKNKIVYKKPEEVPTSSDDNKDDYDKRVTPARSSLVRSSLNPYEEAKEKYAITNRDSSKPYIISEEEFKHHQNANKLFEKASLILYTEDGLLVDDEDKEVEVNYTVGESLYDMLTNPEQPMHIRYIRNEQTGIDFEISVVEGAFPYGDDEQQ